MLANVSVSPSLCYVCLWCQSNCCNTSVRFRSTSWWNINLWFVETFTADIISWRRSWRRATEFLLHRRHEAFLLYSDELSSASRDAFKMILKRLFFQNYYWIGNIRVNSNTEIRKCFCRFHQFKINDRFLHKWPLNISAWEERDVNTENSESNL